MALIEIVDGPSNWDLLLAGFDRRPSGLHRVRTLRFELKGGHEFWMELAGVDWPETGEPDENTLTIRGPSYTRMPTCYRFEGRQPEMHYNPKGGTKRGQMHLSVVSPCCGAHLIEGLFRSGAMEVVTGCCMSCNQPVVRQNLIYLRVEWLDDERPDAHVHGLREVGLLNYDITELCMS